MMLVLAQSVLSEKVIVGFKGKPTIEGKRLDIINAVAADLPEKAIEALQNNPNVRYVEPDYEMHALGYDWGVDRIEADVVHTYPNTGSQVRVAVIDTGIYYKHADLGGCFGNDCKIAGGWDFVNNDADPLDDAGHGTHVAGTIASNLATAYTGVAPDARLYALKVLDANGGGSLSDLIAALQWAVANDIDIASMSLGSDYDLISVREACDAAYEAGVLLVAAAGNDGNRAGRGDSVDYPGAYESVIAVAATDSSDRRAYFSSTGPAVEISAPGVSIRSTTPSGYATMSGTSMATPHVSGVAALIFASPVPAEYGSEWDAVEVRQKLQMSTIDLGSTGRDSLYGLGLIMADLAVEGVPVPPEDVHDVRIAGINHPDSINVGDPVQVDVVVSNVGDFPESTDVLFNGESVPVDLAIGQAMTLPFTWLSNTAGTFELRAEIVAVEAEVATQDNVATSQISVTDGSACVSHGAFCNCDKECNKKETPETCPWDCP